MLGINKVHLYLLFYWYCLMDHRGKIQLINYGNPESVPALMVTLPWQQDKEVVEIC
jgi:hypothetical protein